MVLSFDICQHVTRGAALGVRAVLFGYIFVCAVVAILLMRVHACVVCLHVCVRACMSAWDKPLCACVYVGKG